MPLVSRVCMNLGRKPQPDRRHAVANYREKACAEEYDECVQPCPGEPYDDVVTDAEQECLDVCYELYLQCLEGPDNSDWPTCDPGSGYCGYDTYDYGVPSEDTTDWGCDSSDDSDYSTDDSSTDWSCSTSDGSDDGSTDSSGWDCSADNSDDGDSGDGDDWGDDWGERSPAGGDGIESPLDLPH